MVELPGSDVEHDGGVGEEVDSRARRLGPTYDFVKPAENHPVGRLVMIVAGEYPQVGQAYPCSP
jgi:hypothetical protein